MTTLLTIMFIHMKASPIVGEDTTPLLKAYQTYQDENFDQAIQRLEPLLKDDTLSANETTKVRELAIATYHRRGEERFRNGQFKESIADFDRELALNPSYKPKHWQRGISLYYAKQYRLGREQFELHQTYNQQDVENAVWHLLCATREPGGSLKKSRRSYIKISADSRIPMDEIHDLYAGTGSVDRVLKRAEEAKRQSAQFYADLYVGLYYDVSGNPAAAYTHIKKAAKNPSAQSHYMGDVARVHLKIMDKEKASD